MIFRKIFNFFVYIFALAGFVLISGFFAIRFNITNVTGQVDNHYRDYQKNDNKMKMLEQVKGDESVKKGLTIADVSGKIDELEKIRKVRQQNYCELKIIGDFYPANARKIVEIAESTKVDPIISKSIMAVGLRLKENADFQNKIFPCGSSNFSNTDYLEVKNKYQSADGTNVFSWVNYPEWQSIRGATAKDKDTINRAAFDADIEPRLIVSDMIVEQLRLFHSEREVFKKFFEPLKILCSANKISLGVMGIKEATAIKIENNIKDPSSPFYLGQRYEHLLDFSTGDVSAERYDRLANEKDHYYSYLYGALYIKQILKQWKDAGYDISYRPEIIGTLFNVGFPQSRPNAEPKVGGSNITIDGKEYSFGSLAYEFYYSGELLDEFPFKAE